MNDLKGKSALVTGASTTPGNKKGGLANIVEKSLGSIVKYGSSRWEERRVGKECRL